MNVKYPTKKQIIKIHEELIKRFGGRPGLRDEALLQSAIGRYQSGYYDDPVEEAAALMESLGGNHPFLDGNKRIAVTAPFAFLMINGYEALLDEDRAYDFFIRLLESGQFSFSNLEPWIRENVKSPEPR
jgi:death-on-curing protein